MQISLEKREANWGNKTSSFQYILQAKVQHWHIDIQDRPEDSEINAHVQRELTFDSRLKSISWPS